MTLALTGKSRRRQTSLVIAAILALFGAIAAGIASRDAAPVAADSEHYTASFNLVDMAGGDTTLREWELAIAELSFTLDEAVAGDGIVLEMDVPDQVQVGGYTKLGLTNSLDCSLSIIAFTCTAPSGADDGYYGLRFLVRQRTSACESGPFTLTTYISHPEDSGSPRAVETNALSFDCSLPPLLDPEVKIGVSIYEGYSPGAVPFTVTVVEPNEPAYELYPSIGSPRSFTTTGGSTYVTIAPPGGIKVVSVMCEGLANTLVTGNELRLTLETGEAADCTFQVVAPHIQIDSCYEGPLGGQPTAARWGFNAIRVDSDTPIRDNRVLYYDPDYPDEPGPFNLADFLYYEAAGWQWSAPMSWPADREAWANWRLEYGTGTLYTVFIDEPGEVTVTQYNICPGYPLSVEFKVCSHFLDESGDPVDTFKFTYVVNGELAAEIPVAEGDNECKVVPMGINNLDTVINLTQYTEPGWANAVGYPKRQISPDQALTSSQGESISFQFHWNDNTNVLGCHEVGEAPGTGAACTVAFENARPQAGDPVAMSLVICNHAFDETNEDRPAYFSYYVDGQRYDHVADSNGGQQSCFAVSLPAVELDEPFVVEQVTPASWAQAPGYPQRRVIHYQDNTAARKPGSSVEVQFSAGKGGEIVCFEPGIAGLAPFEPLPGTGLACHVIFENLRTESPETPTPTATATPTEPAVPPTVTATPTTPTQAPTQPASQSTATPPASTASPTAPTATASPDTSGGQTPATVEPATPGDGESTATVEPEATVAGERTPAPGSTPIAPSTGETAEIAGRPASVWAVLACLLFAASMAFTLAAFWKQQR